MKKSLYIVMMMCLLSGWTVRAQRTVDLDFRQVTLNVVFDAIERALPARASGEDRLNRNSVPD